MRKDIKDLEKRVIKEATILRKILTEEEKGNLNFEKFESESRTACIYGQITGNCFSQRASELIEKACTKVYNPRTESEWAYIPLNGSPKGLSRNQAVQDNEYYSPIEVFIGQDENLVERDWEGELEFTPSTNNCEKLLNFIKGESEKLVFEY